jgi:rubredoxin
MMKNERDRYICAICGYIYDPVVIDRKSGLTDGVSFSDLSDDWMCPGCGAGTDRFMKVP